MSYDHNNIFARILRGEIPHRPVYDDAWTLAFHDIAPKAPIHVLVIPKGPYLCADDFYSRATPDEIVGYARGLAATIEALQVTAGYRLIANCGTNGGAEVPHFHTHILGGRPLGPMA